MALAPFRDPEEGFLSLLAKTLTQNRSSSLPTNGPTGRPRCLAILPRETQGVAVVSDR